MDRLVLDVNGCFDAASGGRLVARARHAGAAGIEPGTL